MTSAFPSRSNTNPLKRKRNPGETELLALFQLIPGPALLLEMPHEQILYANGALLQLTAFSLNEIAGRGLRSLIQGLPEHDLTAEDIINVSLERRGRTPLSVDLQARPLDAACTWLILTIEVHEERRSLVSRMEQVAHALSEVNHIQQDQNTRQNLERGLNVACSLLEANVAAVYQVDVEGLAVVKMAEAGEQGLLPERFPAGDLLRLDRTYLWQPGRRVQTELHRLARIQSLSCLGSTPLRGNGLLVVGDRLLEPSDALVVVIEALGKQISGMLEHLNQVSSLSGQLKDTQRELVIWQGVGENAQEGILLLAADGSVVHMNPACEWMLGYASWEVKGQQVENILIGPERLGTVLQDAAAGIPTHNLGNVSLHRRNGQSFPAHIQVIPVERGQQIVAILVFFSDVSEHVEIRNRTQQLEQRAVLGEVTAVFAHEVRNPINNISTGLQLLSVKLPENDPNQENIGRLLNDCQRLNHLMESVLNFSRHVEHKFEEVDLEALLRRLLDRWRPRTAKVSVTAFFQAEENTPHVLADPRSLEQVFTNLVGNAVEAMSEKGGTLALRIAPFRLLPSRLQVEVTVSDTGPGIPDEIRERIFEPFVTTKPQGTGLGLAITKRIVTAHHGNMSVNSFPGGTVFQVYLPAYQAESAG